MRRLIAIAILVAVGKIANGQASNTEPAIEAYRKMWRSLTPEQQKQMLSSGGVTPEQYERMMRQNDPARESANQAPDYARAISGGTLDGLGGSLKDLNAIRDANVARLQKDGCPPEVATRIADLKGRIAALRAGASPALAAPKDSESAAVADPIEMAESWFKAAPAELAQDAGTEDPLDSVLPGRKDSTRARPAKAVPLKPGERRMTAAEEITRIDAEIARLQGACIEPKY